MLVSIFGDVGSGKTLLATYLALHDPRKVFANYLIKIANYNELKPETLANISEPSLIVIDEAYTWLESRTSTSNVNRFMSYILFQSRKREMDIILTEQLIGSIDLRFREMTNYEIFCQQIQGGFEYTIFKMSNYGFQPKRFIMPYKIAKTIFDKYDSWELISSINEDMLFKVSEDKEDIISTIDSIVSELTKIAEPYRITKAIVSDYCLRNRFPHSYVDLAYNRVKMLALASERSPEPEPAPQVKESCHIPNNIKRKGYK